MKCLIQSVFLLALAWVPMANRGQTLDGFYEFEAATGPYTGFAWLCHEGPDFLC
jgi:hypothetical protein